MSEDAAPPPRWTRPAEFLVYLVPVGDIPTDLFASYARLLRAHSVLPLRSLTRPGGYAAELSPFRSLDWGGDGVLRFHFVSANERVDAVDGEDVAASRRVVGVLGVCHSPSLPVGGLRAAHAQFEASVRRFPGLLLHKCFAFEHSFDDATAQECEGLADLVMFPVHHELQGTGESTVTLHLQVVMDTLAVNLLMALESVIRSTTSAAVTSGLTPRNATGDLANTLLDVNVEPHDAEQAAATSPLVLSRDDGSDPFSASAASPPSRSSLSTGPSFSSIPSPLAAGVGAISALDPRNRRRKRQLARREKLLGDYCVLVSCVSDAVDHYAVAVEMLRDEERRTGGAPGDALWLAASLEGYVYCLYVESQDKFSTELVEKASEAVGFYAKAGTTELESLLIENVGWYYVGVAIATLSRSSLSSEAKVTETLWVKRLLWEALERGLMTFPELQTQRQVEFLVQTSRMLEQVGHRRRVAFFLHEGASLLLGRNAPSVDDQLSLLLSPTRLTPGPQRQRDLEAALILERVAATRLGIRNVNERDGVNGEAAWEVTQLYRRHKAERVARKQMPTRTPDNSWLIIRFHVLRQLLTIARLLGDTLLVGTYCLDLLEMLVWCESIAEGPVKIGIPSSLSPRRPGKSALVDHLQQPASLLRTGQAPAERAIAGLHARGGVYFSPPLGIDTKVKRNFINSPSATMSNAAASLSSTLTNTPRMLATPRQQFSAAVNAISTKASPAFTPFGHGQHHYNGTVSRRSAVGEERTQNLKMPNGRDTSYAAANGDTPGSRVPVDDDLYKSPLSSPLAEVFSVWNLRSKVEIAKVERTLLSLLESECTTMRSSEQVQLSTFLCVNRLRLRSSCNLQHPFLCKETALGVFGAQADLYHQEVKSDFFYSPFEKQKQARKGAQSSDSASVDGDNAPAIYERGFPVQERIELQLILSNPLGVAVKLEQVKAWVEFVGSEKEKGGAAPSPAVECYSCFLTLDPYEKHKTVLLAIRPLQKGIFRVRGCFTKAFNLTTSYTLNNPVVVRVVKELPMVSFSVRESGSVGLPDGASQQDSLAKVRVTMFANETKRCVVRVRSSGSRPITHYRLAVSVQQRRAAKKTRVLFNNLPRVASNGDTEARAVGSSSVVADDTHDQIDTQGVSVRCCKVDSFPQLLASGDSVSISFEVALQRNYDPNETSDEVQVEWSFVYADETAADEENEIFYRESKFVVELVALPSLTLQSISLLPRDRSTTAQLQTTDHSSCVIVVHVVNPTETFFRFRVHRRSSHSIEGVNSGVVCEAAIDRQSSRYCVVEVPRLEILAVEHDSGSLIDALNDLLRMEWETHFGARGDLKCENCHVGSATDVEQYKLDLVLPALSFQILSPSENTLTPAGDAAAIACPFPNLFQAPSMQVDYKILQAGLFEYVPFVVTTQPSLKSAGRHAALCVEIEVVITEEGDDSAREMSDHVVVVGLLKTQLRWGPTDETARHHELQCMFLAQGRFCIAVCGRVLFPDTQRIGARIWCHQPMHVKVGKARASEQNII